MNDEGASTMIKTHISLPTARLADSVAFYRTLLDAEPAKDYRDYALFDLESPGLELALDARTTRPRGGGEHYGIVVQSREQVASAERRLVAGGYAIDREPDVTCCYAREDKVWATDPDGRRWEVYTVLEELDEGAGCCATQTTACCND